MPSGLAIAAAYAGLLGVLGQASAPGDAAVVLCHAQGDGRVYRLSRRTEEDRPVWSLSMRREAAGNGWIHLALPGAEPQVGEDTLALRYRNANGGRQLELEVTPSGSRLDVWVDYGLDVNIEPDLDPDVDEMNTEGPIAVECTMATP